jgi:hypothetical protein
LRAHGLTSSVGAELFGALPPLPAPMDITLPFNPKLEPGQRISLSDWFQQITEAEFLTLCATNPLIKFERFANGLISYSILNKESAAPAT